MRIVSLCPSLTETLFSVGLGEFVVGVTSFCIHPNEARKSARVVGGTKNPNLDLILQLNPTHVIVDTEENRSQDIAWLKERTPVCEFTIHSVMDLKPFFSFCRNLNEGKAANAIHSINYQIAQILEIQPQKSFKAFYPIWKDPWMSINRETYIHDILDRTGFYNICGHMSDKYPNLDQLEDLETPEIILLPSEPYHFTQDVLPELPWKNIPAIFVDGEMVCWYGTRTRLGLTYLKGIHSQFNTI